MSMCHRAYCPTSHPLQHISEEVADITATPHVYQHTPIKIQGSTITGKTLLGSFLSPHCTICFCFLP